MKSLSLFILGTIMCVMVGCHSTQKKEPKVQEFVNVPIAVTSSQIPANSSEKYITKQRLNSYVIGRYIDPNDNQVMHEAHTIYQNTQSPKWNLMPQVDADPIALEKSQKAIPTAPLLGQLENALNKIKAEKENIKSLSSTIKKNSLAIVKIAEALNRIEKQNQCISHDIGILSKEIQENQRKIKVVEQLRQATNTSIEVQ